MAYTWERDDPENRIGPILLAPGPVPAPGPGHRPEAGRSRVLAGTPPSRPLQRRLTRRVPRLRAKETRPRSAMAGAGRIGKHSPELSREPGSGRRRGRGWKQGRSQGITDTGSGVRGVFETGGAVRGVSETRRRDRGRAEIGRRRSGACLRPGAGRGGVSEIRGGSGLAWWRRDVVETRMESGVDRTCRREPGTGG